jgi:hypothetical protein
MVTTTSVSRPNVRISDLIDLIRAEYLEVPGLHLTLSQAQRLWGLDDLTSSIVFDALVEAQFLKRTRSGAYALVNA